MKRLSLQASLIGAVALLAATIAVVGFMGISGLSTLNDRTREITGNWLPAIDAVHMLNEDVGEWRELELRHALSGEGQEMDALEKEMARKLIAINKARKTYEPLRSEPDEFKNYDIFQNDWMSYLDLHNQFIKESRLGGAGAGNGILNKEMKPLYTKIARTLDTLIDINREGSNRSAKDATEAYASVRVKLITGVGFGLALAMAGMLFIVFRIARPLTGVTQAMSKLAEGDTGITVPYRERSDEIGRMAGTLQVFQTNMLRARALEAEAEKNKSAAEAQRKQDTAELARGFRNSVGGIVMTVATAATELQATAASLTEAAEETSSQSSNVAAATEQTTAAIRTVAGSAEELSRFVEQIRVDIDNSRQASTQAVREAEETTAQIGDLTNAAERIGSIVGMISNIASQTNLLALNATIEAARAGDAGKGFAVVAQEVKTLAEQTARATADISSQIGTIQASTQNAEKAIERISLTIRSVAGSSDKISSAVGRQAEAAREMATSANEVSAGADTISDNINGVSRAVHESGAAASQVLAAAGELSGQSEKLRHELDNFLGSLEAA